MHTLLKYSWGCWYPKWESVILEKAFIGVNALDLSSKAAGVGGTYVSTLQACFTVTVTWYIISPHSLIVPFCFNTGTSTGAAHWECLTGVMIPRLFNLCNSSLTSSLSKSDKGQALKRSFTCGSMWSVTFPPLIVPSFSVKYSYVYLSPLKAHLAFAVNEYYLWRLWDCLANLFPVDLAHFPWQHIPLIVVFAHRN